MLVQEKELYNFLYYNFLIDKDKWVTQEEICDALPMYFTLNHKAVKKMCCSYIQKYIMSLNESNEIEEIILYKNQTYKIAKDIDEARSFLKSKLLIKACKMLKRYWGLLDKVNKDGQFDLEGNEIKAFIDNELKQ